MKRVFVFALALAAFACAQSKYEAHITPAPVPNVDFTPYQTWDFGREGQYPATGVEDVDTPQFRAAVAQHIITDMSGLGYANVDSNPDFVLLLNVGAQQQVDQQKMDDYNRGYDMAWSQIGDSDVWNEGTIAIIAADAKTGQMIWSSSADGRLQSYPGYEKRLERFNNIVSQMLADFPKRTP